MYTSLKCKKKGFQGDWLLFYTSFLKPEWRGSTWPPPSGPCLHFSSPSGSLSPPYCRTEEMFSSALVVWKLFWTLSTPEETAERKIQYLVYTFYFLWLTVFKYTFKYFRFVWKCFVVNRTSVPCWTTPSHPLQSWVFWCHREGGSRWSMISAQLETPPGEQCAGERYQAALKVL